MTALHELGEVDAALETTWSGRTRAGTPCWPEPAFPRPAWPRLSLRLTCLLLSQRPAARLQLSDSSADGDNATHRVGSMPIPRMLFQDDHLVAVDNAVGCCCTAAGAEGVRDDRTESGRQQVHVLERIFSLVSDSGCGAPIEYRALFTYSELPNIAPLATPSRLSGSMIGSSTVPDR